MAEIQSEKSFSDTNLSGIVSREIETKLEHISVCICTYLRPNMLADLIEALLIQKTYNRFQYSLIIVDNDPSGSACETVESYIKHSQTLQNSIKIEYHHKPVKGITYARNKSLECSTGEYIAFIDDDEVPEPDWLYQLYKALNEFKSDAVFGTVLPNFEVSPPGWVLNHRFFYWRDVRKGTGRGVGTAVTTNNALVRRDLIVEYNLKFDHDFAFAGGEDQAFFFTLLKYKKDARYINCDKAVVHELITSKRCDPEYIRKRFLLEGRGRVVGIYKFSDTKTKAKFLLMNRLVQSLLRLSVLYILLFILFFINKGASKKFQFKTYYHIGVLSAIFNLSPYSDRKSIGLL